MYRVDSALTVYIDLVTRDDENRPDEMAAAGLSEKTGDRLKRRESNRKRERTGSGASLCLYPLFQKD